MTPCSFCAAHNILEAQNCRACGAPLRAGESTTLPLGTRLQNGAFEIERVLGRGGFGVTYEARDLMLERSVAIKEFFPHDAARQGAMVLPGVLRPEEYRAARGKFLLEARMLARFKHPGIVDVYGVFEENNSVYMTMEFARGKTLGQLLHARNAPMDESEAVGYLRQVGEALAVVHDAGLLHRDIKPENVVVDMGRALLIDFGTAGEQSSALNAGPRRPVIVTPGYAPLEQYAQSARRGPFTDVYALGATLYHLLSSQAPPPAPDVAKGVEIRPLQELNPQVSVAVAQTVQAALQTEVARRPQTVRAFLCGLDGSISYAPEIEADDETFGDADYDLLNRRAKAIQDLARGHREALGYLPPLTPQAAANATAPHIAAPVVRVPSAASASLPAANAPAAVPASGPGVQTLVAPRRNWGMPLFVAGMVLIPTGVRWMTNSARQPRFMPGSTYSIYGSRHYIDGREIFPGNPDYNRFNRPRSSPRLMQPVPELHAAPATPLAEVFDPQPRVIRKIGSLLSHPAFARDGRLIAVQAWSGQIAIVDAATGQERSRLKTASRSWMRPAFSPDGKLLAVPNTAHGLELFEVASGDLRHTFSKPTPTFSFVDAVGFSPDGSRMMASSQGAIAFWDTRSGKLLRTLNAPSVPLVYPDKIAAFAPNGREWVSADPDGTLRWRELQSGSFRTAHLFSGNRSATNKLLTFSPDGSRSAYSDPHGIRLLRGTKPALEIGWGTPWCFSRDNAWLVGRGPGGISVAIWNAKTGALMQRLEGLETNDAADAAFTPDGQTLRIVGSDGTLVEWKRISQTRQTAPVARRVVPRRRVNPAVIPPVHVQFAHSQPPSQIIFSETVPPSLVQLPGLISAEEQILKRYNAWKAAHAESNPETLLQFYAPDAETTSGNMADLRRYLQQNEGQNWQSVQDLQTPKWWFRADGEQVVLDVFLRYLNGWGVAESAGMRRLFWQQRDGQWLIVRDRSDAVIGSTPVS